MLYKQVQEALDIIRMKTDFQPKHGIILGTGLGGLTNQIKIVKQIAYHEIPHFPLSTVQSHSSKLIFGYLGEQAVVAMAGRFHYYEGYSMKQVTFPVRVLKMLGIERIIISNVSGSLNVAINAGELVLVRDHINLQPDNPLRGINDDRFGPRFPDMLHTYDRSMIEKAKSIAQKADYTIHEGVYVGLQGPNLETPAEYEYLHRIGGDLVGMSTVPEVIVARHMGLPVFVISVVSNKCYPIAEIKETKVEDVIALARQAEPRMSHIVKELLHSV